MGQREIKLVGAENGVNRGLAETNQGNQIIKLAQAADFDKPSTTKALLWCESSSSFQLIWVRTDTSVKV